MRDYTKGKIYKIVNDIDDYVYVGSTTDTLCRRLTRHRTDMKRNLTFNIYEHMKKHGIEHFKIILIRNACCSSGEELLREERIEYDKINKTLLLNKIKPILLNRDDKKQTKKEYNIKNIEHIRKKRKEYHAKNREEIIIKHRKYYETTKNALRYFRLKKITLLKQLPFYGIDNFFE